MTVLLLVIDFTVGEGLSLLGLPVPDVAGDLIMLEVGILAVLGGFVEFSRSKGVYEFRRAAFHSDEQFSTVKHSEASRIAVMFFSAALGLFLILMILAMVR
jgi:hypothetical protein